MFDLIMGALPKLLGEWSMLSLFGPALTHPRTTSKCYIHVHMHSCGELLLSEAVEI